MTNQKTSLKSWLILIVVLGAITTAYFYFEGSLPVSTSSIVKSSADDQGALVGAQVFGLLNQVKGLKIDTRIFTDPVYATLRDYSVDIPTLNVGRNNPFEPFAGDESLTVKK